MNNADGNNLTGREIPLGLGMAFAQNTQAMEYFASLPREQQQSIIDRAHGVRSKQEMQAFVSGLGARAES